MPFDDNKKYYLPLSCDAKPGDLIQRPKFSAFTEKMLRTILKSHPVKKPDSK